MGAVTPTAAEVAGTLPGDELVPDANVVMDRAFDLDAPLEQVWPWFVQLGKQRAGWYFPRSVERFVPRSRRGLRRLDPRFDLTVGDVIPDWGGREETFEVAILDAPTTLVHISRRGHVRLSWAITLHPVGDDRTRAHLRLRMAGIKRERLAEVGGGLFDWATILGLAAGLRERL